MSFHEWETQTERQRAPLTGSWHHNPPSASPGSRACASLAYSERSPNTKPGASQAEWPYRASHSTAAPLLGHGFQPLTAEFLQTLSLVLFPFQITCSPWATGSMTKKVKKVQCANSIRFYYRFMQTPFKILNTTIISRTSCTYPTLSYSESLNPWQLQICSPVVKTCIFKNCT